MSLSDEMQKYIDPETGMIRAPDGGRDNMVLFTMTLAEISDPIMREFWVHKAAYFLLYDVFVTPGLFRRYPGATGSNSVDNLIAAACAGNATGIYQWGHLNHWCFNVEEPHQFRWRHWYGRFIGLRPFLAMLIWKRIGLILQLRFMISCIFSALSSYGDTSNKCLQYLMNLQVEHRYPLVNLGIRLWRRIMQRKYPGGMSEVYSVYFGADHPFAKYARKDFL